MPLCAPPVIAGSVGSNAHQPGAERRPAAKRLYTAKGSNKHILCDISRGITIPQHAEDDAIRALLVIEHQLIERVDIPKLAAGNELYLILSHKLCHMLPHFLSRLPQFNIFPALFHRYHAHFLLYIITLAGGSISPPAEFRVFF